MKESVKMILRYYGRGDAFSPLLRYLFYKKSPTCVREVRDIHDDPVETISYELQRDVPEEDIWIEYLRDLLAQYCPIIDSRNISHVTFVLAEHDSTSDSQTRSPILEITLEEEDGSTTISPEKEWDPKHLPRLDWLKAIVYPCEDAIRIWCEDLKMAVEQGFTRKVHEDWHIVFNHIFYECWGHQCQEFCGDWHTICYMDKYWDWEMIYNMHKDTFDKWGIKPKLKKEKSKQK